MVCHCSVPDGLLQPEAGVLNPATPLYPANATGPFDPAKAMTPPERRQLALEAVAETATVSHLARRHAVSRKFVYRQAAKAEEALDAAFSPADPDDQRVLFQLPVTKPWLRQLILGLTLICHSSLRGVVELLGDVFDYPISVGTVHNVLQAAVAQAQACSKQQDLAGVRIGAHDELFQSSRPVLVGIDADSTYCYLLSLEDHRDAETWGVRLLELQAQGFQPEATIADTATLLKWLREDVFSVAGPDHATRCDLFDFLVAELHYRELLCPHRIGPVVRALANQRDDLLTFASQLDRDLTVLAAEFQIAVETARSMLNVELLPPRDPSRWGREAALRSQLGGRCFSLRVAAAEVASQTVRASSLVENLNSRLRNYFFLRRHLGPDYLALLQFFLNHRRFVRSQRPERAGKSPAELLSSSPHPHWLEMLGYKRFSRN